MTRTISHVQGKGCLAHNNRCFRPKNVDHSRTPDNITYIKQDIGEAYRELFDEAVMQYNAQQKRNDRKIRTSYYEHVFNHAPCSKVIESANGQKSFYEDLVQIGTMNDTGIGSHDAEIAKICLDEYMKGFGERNPNFYVFNAVLHMDEATPHLHINYIPIGHYKKRGIPVQNGLAQALREMGHGGGKDAINRWRVSEREVLRSICTAHGFDIAEEKQGRGYSFTVDEYKKHRDIITDYEQKEETLRSEIQPLLDEKAIADTIVVKGLSLPGNKKIISKSELSEIETQKKALAVQTEEVRHKNDDLDSRQTQLDEREHSLAEREKKIDEDEADINKRKRELSSKESYVEFRRAEADSLYYEQTNLNDIVDNLRSDLYKREDQLMDEKSKNSSLEETVRDLRRRNDRLKDEKKEQTDRADRLEKEKADAEAAASERERSLTDRIADLETKVEFHNKYEQALYDVGCYLGDKFGIDFMDAADKRFDGYRLGYIFGGRNEYER